jgi:hypothetical protein
MIFIAKKRKGENAKIWGSQFFRESSELVAPSRFRSFAISRFRDLLPEPTLFPASADWLGV